jgi:hypothetical protein
MLTIRNGVAYACEGRRRECAQVNGKLSERGRIKMKMKRYRIFSESQYSELETVADTEIERNEIIAGHKKTYPTDRIFWHEIYEYELPVQGNEETNESKNQS